MLAFDGKLQYLTNTMNYYLFEFLAGIHASCIDQMIVNDHNTSNIINIETRQRVRNILKDSTVINSDDI